MHIVVDQALCIGAAPCVAIAGSVFQLNEDGKVFIVDIAGSDDDTIKLAAESCPVHAIFLFDKEGGIQIY